MYLLYVDESGDIGLAGSSTRYFVLSGIVVHELRWRSTLENILRFRKELRASYGLKLRHEIHASAFIHAPKDLVYIPKWNRLRILRDVVTFESNLTDISIINVVVDKSMKPEGFDVFDCAWKTLLQRFHNTIQHKNFPGPQNPDERGIVIADETDGNKLRHILRRMRRYNPVPNMYGAGFRMIDLDLMIEDPVHRHSGDSYSIQLADVNAYLLTQRLNPCGYIRKKGGRGYFDRLDPVLCKVASKTDAQGIVRV